MSVSRAQPLGVRIRLWREATGRRLSWTDPERLILMDLADILIDMEATARLMKSSAPQTASEERDA